MTVMRPLFAMGLALVVGVGAVCASAAALDAPALEYVNSGRTSSMVNVVSGVTGAPGGFTIEWMPAAQFDALGGWPAAGDPAIKSVSCFGLPTLNIWDGTVDFALPPFVTAGIQIGDFFDETGISGSGVLELAEGTEYVVRVRANATEGSDPSAYSSTLRTTTINRVSQDCTYTLGYWKTHSSAWPVGGLTLGTVAYNQTQLLSILNQPAGGNGLISLAHQLIAAKLNIAQGAVAPIAVQNAIASADAMIGALVVPPVGAGSLPPGNTSSLTQQLDDFNNGVTGPGHCGTVPARATTWGALKSSYR